MNLGKRLGRIGFVVAFSGAFLFYASPFSWFSFESHFVCPWCPYTDIILANRLQLGLTLGLASGLLLALIGFCTGYAVTLARGKKTATVNAN